MIGLKPMEDSKNDPQISTPDGTWKTNGALDKKKKKKSLCFLWRKMELKKSMLVLLMTPLPVTKFTAAMTSEKLSNIV